MIKLNDIDTDNYDCDVDFIKGFEELKHKYRVCCEFAHVSDIDFKVIKNTPVIFGYNHKICVYPITNDICRAHIMVSANFEKRFKEHGIEYIEYEEEMSNGTIKKIGQFGESGEYILDFYLKDIDEVANIFKFKKCNSYAKNPYSLRNLHEYLRFMRNIDPWYNDILDKRLLANRDPENND